MSSRKIRNWDGTQSWEPEAIHYPRDEKEIVELIKGAAEDRKCIKAVGRALSWSDIIDMPEMAIRFDKMDEVLEVDRDNRRIRLQAGTRLKNVNEILAKHGLAFDNFGSIILQTDARRASSALPGL